MFHDLRHPREAGPPEIEAFLSHLANEQHVSASTQNQALEGLLFLYVHVLSVPLDRLGEFTRAKLSARFPAGDIALVIRTSGEHRISNFTLWQLSYSELYFTNTLFPEFDAPDLARASEGRAHGRARAPLSRGTHPARVSSTRRTEYSPAASRRRRRRSCPRPDHNSRRRRSSGSHRSWACCRRGW
jgi:hypothetical protein